MFVAEAAKSPPRSASSPAKKDEKKTAESDRISVKI
jgi:hypothetical protein